MRDKLQYVTTERVDKTGATYRLLIGQRSNGKTFAALQKALEDFTKTGRPFAYIRRWDVDIRGAKGEGVLRGHVNKGIISSLTKGEYDGIVYRSRAWYFCKTDGDGKTKITAPEPCGYAFAINEQEHEKSLSYPVHTIIFDEFLARDGYLVDEFVLYMNLLSTLIREREDPVIYMLGNTINKYCPYFREMGLTGVRDMVPGDLKVYKYGDSRLTVAIQFTDALSRHGKPSDFYFAFDNPRLKMITTGEWELSIYPHCPDKLKPQDVVFSYFILFENDLLQADIINIDGRKYTFIHQKTTPLKYPDNDLIYCPEYSTKPNWRRKINVAGSDVERKIWNYFVLDKVVYQDNTVGEVVRNYLQFCGVILK